MASVLGVVLVAVVSVLEKLVGRSMGARPA
jgi:hypothetical protein